MPSPEVIQAIGVAVAAILTAWQARTASKVRELEGRVKAVEAERDKFRSLFRASVRYIRVCMAWGMTNAPGVPFPPLPTELTDEV